MTKITIEFILDLAQSGLKHEYYLLAVMAMRRKTTSFLSSFLVVAIALINTSSSVGSTVTVTSDISKEKGIIAPEISLNSLTNYQVNNDRMVSSGLPSAAHFQLLKDEGIGRVIDLIPGERGQEQLMVEALSLNYHNIQVEWEHPTLANFKEYTGYMAQANSADDKVLTHCKLNWRGAVFTYLYRITALGESELSAKQDLLAIWQPNQTWFQFINTVIDDFNQTHNAQLVTSVTPQIEPLEQ